MLLDTNITTQNSLYESGALQTDIYKYSKASGVEVTGSQPDVQGMVNASISINSALLAYAGSDSDVGRDYDSRPPRRPSVGNDYDSQERPSGSVASRANNYCNECAGREGARSKKRVLTKGFNEIDNSYDASRKEKVMADYGQRVMSHTSSTTPEEEVRAGYSVMKRIGSPQYGRNYSTAKEIAGVSQEIAGNQEMGTISRELAIRDGFKVIENSYETSEQEKSLARFGEKATNNYSMDPREKGKVGYVIMEGIKNPQYNTPSREIAYRTLQISNYDDLDMNTKKKVMDDAFEEIMNSGNYSQRQSADEGLRSASYGRKKRYIESILQI